MTGLGAGGPRFESGRPDQNYSHQFWNDAQLQRGRGVPDTGGSAELLIVAVERLELGTRKMK